MYFVYILRLANGQHYIGQTRTLAQRLERHQAGYCRATRPYRPVELLYSEEYGTRSQAMAREKQLKGWKSRAAISKLISTAGGPIV